MSEKLVQLSAKPRQKGQLGFFRYRSFGDQVLLTNLVGDWAFVSRDELRALSEGPIDPASPLHQRLESAHMLASAQDVERLAERTRRRKGFLDYGPNLHILVVTLRCNQTCVYCHASRADMTATSTDMSKETAAKVVDLILQSTSPSVTIEFQGGEPLANFDVVRFVVNYAVERNRSYGKNLEFSLVSNLSLMDEEKLKFLLEHRVQICTSVDGPPPIHDAQRLLVVRDSAGKASKQSSFAEAARWIARINKAYGEMGLDQTLYHVEALLTTTRESLRYPKEIVDTYVGLGCRAIFLRPVDPFGFASKGMAAVNYARTEFLEFYKTAVEYILELNRKGEQVLERFASIFLTKILTGDDPNYLDIRSPCGAGIGQLAYNYDGRIFTCDEGRMVDQTGDPMFEIGQVDTASYRKLMQHPTVNAMLVASNLDAQPDCVNCAYSPYCGVCPVHNYATQKSLFGQMRASSWCAVHKGIQDFLFEKLRTADPETRAILQKWTTARPRTHFVQSCEAR